MKTALWILAGLAATAAAAVSVVVGWQLAAGAMNAEAGTWLVGRAAGVTSYALLALLVVTGLLLSHPWARHLTVPSARTRVTIHATLSLFTLVFVVLHLVVLALDSYAGVGWLGALVPFTSKYRPVAVGLGVLVLWAGIITGVTARFAGRAAGTYWWPIHKVAAVLLVMVWLHSVLAGSDVAGLTTFYVATGAFVVALAVTRYAARTPADHAAALTTRLAAQSRRRARARSAR